MKNRRNVVEISLVSLPAMTICGAPRRATIAMSFVNPRNPNQISLLFYLYWPQHPPRVSFRYVPASSTMREEASNNIARRRLSYLASLVADLRCLCKSEFERNLPIVIEKMIIVRQLFNSSQQLQYYCSVLLLLQTILMRFKRVIAKNLNIKQDKKDKRKQRT